MVSQRQRLAKKKFKEANPDKFPKQEPTPPKNPDKKKKNKPKFKKKSDPNKKVSTHKKHPLRVPGMRPGESCYICKEVDHIAKNCPQKAQWEKNKICLSCRQRGHSLKNCPNKNDQTVDRKLCYNCGGSGHSLAECPQPREEGGTKFANCFICSERGHLSKNCPKNTHGIYPKGGCCKICSGVTHLARDCPNKGIRSTGIGKISARLEDRPTGQVTKLTSGDDLDDDFTMEDAHAGNAEEPINEKIPSLVPESTEKTKKKHGPKVVNFVGAPVGLYPTQKDTMANAASGMSVHDDCKLKFMELKSKRNYRYITYKIEDQQVVVDKLGGPDESYDDFSNSLPADECRYAIYDFDFTTVENCQKSKIFFVAWSPDTSKVRMKMVYASSKDRFKRELDGIGAELQATDPSEMSLDVVKSRAV
ncbi:uncharacterized protein LOC141691991 [Apium graveolens]|uniref:uncharacterized protein LOC141691991 n=1 Tax=Apium graveolens TaxID=4045 RepID=UPI003D7ADA55